MKISDFLKEKLNNFKIFALEQMEKAEIPKDKCDKLIEDLEIFQDDINSFIKSVVNLAKLDIDTAINIFLLNYDININDIKDKIDYDKLRKYIECFIDIVKN